MEVESGTRQPAWAVDPTGGRFHAYGFTRHLVAEYGLSGLNREVVHTWPTMMAVLEDMTDDLSAGRLPSTGALADASSGS